MFWEDWKDPDKWGSWDTCDWTERHSGVNHLWQCLLPHNHHGPHLGPSSWEEAPYGEHNMIEQNGVWVPGGMCYYCNRRHPGFRHATDADKVVICRRDGDWGPEPNEGPVMGTELFVPDTDPFLALPTPPKFNSVEEADAWLEGR